MCDKPTRARDRVRRVNARAHRRRTRSPGVGRRERSPPPETRRPPGCDPGDQLLSHFVATLLQITAVAAGRTGRPGPMVLGWKELRRAGGAAPRYRACGARSAKRPPVCEKESRDRECAPSCRLNRCLTRDRKSTRLNSSHGYISYAVFCLKKKNTRHH